jgi:hypothetical protein
MSSEISIDRSTHSASDNNHDALQPWQLFTLAGLAGATAVVFVARDTGPAGVILLSLTVGAAAWMGHTAWRTLAPLFGLQVRESSDVLGGRTRAALERDKVLVLRAIRDLEFDRAMGKVSDKDFAEMNARLRARAARILRQLDSSAGYRQEIERELQKRLASTGVTTRDPLPAQSSVPAEPLKAPVSTASVRAGGVMCTCGAMNDIDARFCKACGSRLEAA